MAKFSRKRKGATLKRVNKKWNSSKRARTMGRGRSSARLRGRVNFGLGLPMKATVTHRYCDTVTITSTAGALAKYQFSANGIYDPNITSTGHQPMYFDQFAALYDHYVVIGSKITIKFIPSTATTTPTMVGVMVNDDTSGLSDITALAEASQVGGYKLLATGESKQNVLVKKWSAKKTFGGSVIANTELQGSGSANPTEQSYYDIYVQNLQASNATVVASVLIEYICIWKELKDIAQS